MWNNNIGKRDLDVVIALSNTIEFEPTEIGFLYSCKRVKDSLENIDKSALVSFEREIHQLSVFRRKQLESDKEILKKTFKPTVKSRLDELSKFNYSSIVKNTIDKFITKCNEAISILEKEKIRILDGTKKLELSQWWLGRINSKYIEYASERGINLEIIPEDYIDAPPEDIDGIRNNLEIVNEIFNELQSGGPLIMWIEEQTKLIYDRIDSFKIGALIVLYMYLDINIQKNELSLQIVNENIKRLDEPLSEELQNLIKDVEYVEEMHNAEETSAERECINVKQKKRLTLSHVVPISGLIMSSFYRLENILRTILELYDVSNSESVEEEGGEEKLILSTNLQEYSIENLTKLIVDASNQHDWDKVIALAKVAKQKEMKS